MALNRAVEINHGRGLPGIPVCGHRLQRSRKGFVHRLLGKIKITEQAHQRRQDSARFRPVKSLNGLAELFGHRRRHLRQTSKRSGSIQLRSGFPYPQFIGVAIVLRVVNKRSIAKSLIDRVLGG